MTDDLAAADFVQSWQPARDVYYEQNTAVLNDARREGTAVDSRPAWHGASAASISFAEPLAGIRLARARAAAAQRVVGDYIRHARQAGSTWYAIGRALGLDGQGDLSDAAVDFAIGPVDAWSRLDASFSWTCLADISVYFAPWSQKGWIDLLNAVAAAQPAPVALSISWGKAEDSPDWSGSAVQEINQRLQAVAMLGITVCASSGDDGVGGQMQDRRAHVNFPATSPFVLSVGGTMLTGTPPEEVAWWDGPEDRSGRGGRSSGGGVSILFPRPA